MKYLENLNEKQLEVVQTTEGYLRVIAGAGSGKTKALVSRFVHLVFACGVDPASILCTTFTNKAANEMKSRIRAFLGDDFDSPLICTYHGFCVRVLREDCEKLFLSENFQILDTEQQKAIIKNIYEDMGLKLDHATYEKIICDIEAYKQNGDYVAHMCSSDSGTIDDSSSSTIGKVIKRYLQYQKHTHSLDFADLLRYTIYLFSLHPEVLEKWQTRLAYIQVDEFQDSTSAEAMLMDQLSSVHHNLMVVGDPDQNIYEWRYSNNGLLLYFDSTHPNTKTIFLTQNYRSTPQILSCANALIEHNKLRLEKDLYTENGNGAPVYHYHTKTDEIEAERIVAIIRRIRDETGCNLASFAILYRSSYLSWACEKKLMECGMPYEIIGNVKFYLRMEIQDILAYLRLIVFDDDVAFRRIVNVPRRKFGKKKMQHLSQLQVDGKSLFTTLQDNIHDPVFRGSEAEDFMRMITNLRLKVNAMSLGSFVHTVCALSGYEKYIHELGDMERLDNVTVFARLAGEFESYSGEPVTLIDFLNHAALQCAEKGEKKADTVKLMTIHAAKGLEFDNVFLIGLSDGIFPSSRSVEERQAAGMEEERRLCYVAITRARKRLFLMDNEGFSLQEGGHKYPSRFLKNIGKQNYIRIGDISAELQCAADCYAAQLFREEPTHTSQKRIGDTITHPIFGPGKIIGEGRSPNMLQVQFDGFATARNISIDYLNNHA